MYSKKDLYIAFLQASSIRYSCNALSDVAPIEASHDVFSKWLKSKTLKPSEVWNDAKNYINDNQSCVLIADDTIIDKRHSKKIEPVRYLYSGNAHDIIPGIAMTNLVWHGIESKTTVSVNFRMYAPEEDGKTNNDHFREMVKTAISRGIKPDALLADTWYSSLDNLTGVSLRVIPVKRNARRTGIYVCNCLIINIDSGSSLRYGRNDKIAVSFSETPDRDKY